MLLSTRSESALGRPLITILIAALGVFLGMSSTALSQAINTCDANMTLSGGVPAPIDVVGDPGCAADPSDGCDFSTTDNVIRTHDIVQYTHSYQTSGTVTDLYVELELQLGMVWDEVPGYCQNQPAGSNITGDGITTPSVIRCELGTATNKAEDLPFNARALGSVLNQSTSGLASAITAGNEAKCEDDTIPEDMTITSAPNYDILKRLPVDLGLSQQNGEDGLGFRYPIGILIDGLNGKGKVGNETLDGGDFTVIDDLSNHVPGGILMGCATAIPRSGYPWPEITGTYGDDRAVVQSGNVTCTQPAGAGGQIEMLVSGMVSGGDTTPTKDYLGGGLPADEYWIFVGYIDVWVPLQPILDNGGDMAVVNHVEFDATDPPVSASGEPNNEHDLTNNDLPHTIVANKGQYAKYSERAANPAYGTSWVGPNPTSSGTKSGVALLAPGQMYTAVVVHNNVGALPYNNMGICDRFDSTTSELVDFPTNPGEAAYLYQTGAAAIQSAGVIEYAYFDYGDPGGVLATAGGTAAGWAGQLNADCGKDTFTASEIPWQSSTTANGYTAADFNVVRWTSTEPNGEQYPGNNIRLFLNLMATTDPAAPPGTILANTSALRRVPGLPDWYNYDSYNPITHSTDLGGNDRNTLAKALVRVQKETVPGDAINSITAGSSVTYKLSPSVTTMANPPGTANMVVLQDTLPLGLTYTANSATQAGAALPPTVTTLADGRQLLEWNFGTVVPNVFIDPIEFTALSQFGLPSGTILENVTVMSSPDDGSTPEQRSDTRTINISNPVGLTIVKQVHTPLIEPAEDIDYTICFANLSTTTDYTATDMIDVFPYMGDGRTPPSAFSGSITFVSAVSSGAAPASILYTSAAAATIDTDPKTNLPADATNATSPWCTLAEINGGTAGCPSIGLADVTAIRVDAGPMAKGAPAACVDMTLTTSGNFEGDLYTNSASVAAPEVENSVSSPDVTTEVVTGEIGDRVWKDYNADGVQDPNEPGIIGVVVNLLDSNGAVIDTETTIADGFYQFTGYPSGTYGVELDASNFAAGGVLEFTTITYDFSGDLDALEKVEMGINDLEEEMDFGYRGQGWLGDTIFHDTDRDMSPHGTGTDVEIDGVKVNLIDPATGDTLQTAITATVGGNAGFYLFEFLCEGTYTVDVDQTNFLPGGPLAGLFITYDPQGAPDNQATVTLGPPAAAAKTAGSQMQVMAWTDPTLDFGYHETPLPIELTSFEAKVDGYEVQLDWTTSTEESNAGFEIQLAQGEGDFKQVGYVEGAGTSTETIHYSFKLEDVDPGDYRVRLMQLDFDGTYTYSDALELVVDLPSDHVFDAAYPNPFNPTTTIEFGVRDQQEVNIHMYDLQGRRVRTLHEGNVVDTGVKIRLSVDASSLASGVYFVRMQARNFNSTQRIVLVK